MPITRIFEEMKEPGYNCLAGAFKTPEREKLYIFSNDYIFQDSPPHYVIHRRNIQKFRSVKTIKDLLASKMTLGVVEKYSYGSWVDSNISKYNPLRREVNVGDNQKSFFQMLYVGRFDFLFAGLEEANYNISSNNDYRSNLVVKSLTDAPEGNKRYMLFNKYYPAETLDKINKAISRVKQNPEYKAIVQKVRR